MMVSAVTKRVMLTGNWCQPLSVFSTGYADTARSISLNKTGKSSTLFLKVIQSTVRIVYLTRKI